MLGQFKLVNKRDNWAKGELNRNQNTNLEAESRQARDLSGLLSRKSWQIQELVERRKILHILTNPVVQYHKMVLYNTLCI